jgi:hypothetical protein
VEETTGAKLAARIKNCLLRYQLQLDKLRDQTYDGASNMSGAYKGCQAIIAREQPLATYVRCAANCTDLVAIAVCSSSAIVRDAMQTVNDLGILCNASSKLKSLLATVALNPRFGLTSCNN